MALDSGMEDGMDGMRGMKKQPYIYLGKTVEAILKKIYTEGYLSGVDGLDPLDDLLIREAFSQLKSIVEAQKRTEKDDWDIYSERTMGYNKAISDIAILFDPERLC